MGKPHPIELRERVVAMVEEGHGHREAARHFRVSPKFVNDMVKLKRETGSLDPKRQGNPGRGKLSDHSPWVRRLLGARPSLTPHLDALAARGLRYAKALTPAPLGCASHRSPPPSAPSIGLRRRVPRHGSTIAPPCCTLLRIPTRMSSRRPWWV